MVEGEQRDMGRSHNFLQFLVNCQQQTQPETWPNQRDRWSAILPRSLKFSSIMVVMSERGEWRASGLAKLGITRAGTSIKTYFFFL